QYLVGEAPQLHTSRLQFAEGARVVVHIVALHVLVGGRRSFLDDGPQVLRQAGQRLFVDQQLDGRLRLLPARVVVIARRLVQAEGQVVVRADPVAGIDGPGLQGGKYLATGQVDRGRALSTEDFATQPGHTDLQALEVIQLVDFLVEPATH